MDKIDPNCPICHSIYSSINEKKKPLILTNCGHTFHKECIEKLIAMNADAKCPMCFTDISKTNIINFIILPLFEKYCSECETEKNDLILCGDCQDNVCKECELKHFDPYLEKLSNQASKILEDINSLIENGKQIKNSSFADLEYAKNYNAKRIPQIKDPIKNLEIKNEVVQFIDSHSELDREINEEFKILENVEKVILAIKKKLENVTESNKNLKYLSNLETEVRRIMLSCQKPFKKDGIVDFSDGQYNVNNPTIKNFNKWLPYELASSKFNGKFDASKFFSDLKNDLDGENTKLQVSLAVMGRSGVGKSTFINTLRGLTPTSSGAIKAGIVETTVDIKPYFIENFGKNHLNKTESNYTSEGLISNTGAKNDEFVIWDTPGVSTPKFRLSEFEITIDRAKCDAFIYLYEVQFNEDDVKAVLMLQKKEKPILICRTKVDSDFIDQMEKKFCKLFKNISKEDRENNYKSIYAELKKKYEEDKIKNRFLSKKKVFFISTKYTNCNKFDYDEFVEETYKSLPNIKSNMLLKMIKATSLNLLAEKKKVLESEIDTVVIQWVRMQPSWSDLKKYIHGQIQDYAFSFGILEMIEALKDDFGRTDELLEELSSKLPCEVISKEKLAGINGDHEIDDKVNLDLSLQFSFYFKNLGLRNKMEKTIKEFMQKQLEILHREAIKMFSSYYLNEYETKIKKGFKNN